MSQHEQHNRRIDPSAMILYGVAAILLLVYLVAGVASKYYAPIPPLLRILMPVLVCLSAYLGARLPRRGEDLVGNAEQRTACRARVRRVLWLCFVLYLHLILTFTLFDPGFGRDFLTILSANAEDRAYYMRWYVNAVPFETIRTIYIDGFRYGYITARYLLLNLAGNICAFAPFAFFLPILWRRIDSFWKFFALMIAIVGSVELCQLALMCGSCDIDDLFLNVGGAVIVWFLLRIPPVKKGIAWLTVEENI